MGLIRGILIPLLLLDAEFTAQLPGPGSEERLCQMLGKKE